MSNLIFLPERGALAADSHSIGYHVDQNHQNEKRVATVLIYLNDLHANEGGKTAFPLARRREMAQTEGLEGAADAASGGATDASGGTKEGGDDYVALGHAKAMLETWNYNDVLCLQHRGSALMEM